MLVGPLLSQTLDTYQTLSLSWLVLTSRTDGTHNRAGRGELCCKGFANEATGLCCAQA